TVPNVIKKIVHWQPKRLYFSNARYLSRTLREKCPFGRSETLRPSRGAFCVVPSLLRHFGSTDAGQRRCG
ncbi:hypothetical protein NPIL_255651, partial [Nephila pilipes]